MRETDTVYYTKSRLIAFCMYDGWPVLIVVDFTDIILSVDEYQLGKQKHED